MLSPTPVRAATVRHLDLHTQFQRSRIFSSLNDEQIEQLVQRTAVRKIQDKVSIDPSPSELPSVHYLVSGRAKVSYMTPDGKQPILYFVSSDELIGEQSILNGTEAQQRVHTMEVSVVASMPTKLLRDFVLQEPAFSTGLCELMCRRRMLIERRIRHTMFLSNRDRLTHLLLDLAEQYGSGSNHHFDLSVKLSHQDLANFIGSTRETVTVVLGKMQSEGLLTIRRRRITLRNVRQLASTVNRNLAE